MLKINSIFKFGDTLDIDAILPQETNDMSQQLSTPYSQVNRNSKKRDVGVRNLYHLHSILIHRGTLGAGHYFAFIKPTMED